MATKLFCDCGCGKSLTGYDAGAGTLLVKSVANIEVEISVRANPDGSRRNLRPACVRELIARGELECPTEEKKVVMLHAVASGA
jgi:hypothetical protein